MSSSILRKVARRKLPPAHIQSIQPCLGIDSFCRQTFCSRGWTIPSHKDSRLSGVRWFTLGTLYLRDRRIMSLMPSLSKIKSSWVKNKLIKVWRDASADLRCGFLSYMAAHKQKLQNWWPPLTSLLIRHIHVAHTYMQAKQSYTQNKNKCLYLERHLRS